MVTAIVLAAGLSSRMGAENKLLFPYLGQPVIASVIETIAAAGIQDIVVVTGHQSEHIRQALSECNVHFAFNPQYHEGMTSSIQQGVVLAKGNGYMICLSDMVLLTPDDYRLLVQAFELRSAIDANCICLPLYKSSVGNPVVFSASYKEAILNNPQPEGCKNIVQRNKEHVFFVEMANPNVLRDFDYPEEYNQLFPAL